MKDFRNLDEDIPIGLLTTLQCNFSCGHCMYECGPDRPAEYMSNDVLAKIERQVARMHGERTWTLINLIGGEPTLRPNELGRILNIVKQWGVTVEMTTNGWWLKSDHAARAVLGAIAPYVDSDGTPEDGISVRISQDPHHDVFHPEKLRGRMEERLKMLWEDEWIADNVPEPNSNYPWLHIDRNRDYWNVNAVGRGADMGYDYAREGIFPSCRLEYCKSLSYTPKGRMLDVCGCGSRCVFGTVDDDPLVLLSCAHAFYQEVKPNCRECHEMAREWAKTRLPSARKEARELYAQDYQPSR
jgi:organic radical activating enzyme